MKDNRVIFLPVPSSLKEEIRRYSGVDFESDPSIPLPSEIDSAGNFDPEKLSWEKILSGMLRVISASAEKNAVFPNAEIKEGEIVSGQELTAVPSEWAEYYRRFVLTVRPGIYHELSGAAVVKAKNGEFDMAVEINGVLEGLFPRSPGVLLNKALVLEDKAAALEKNGHPAEKENALALEAYEAALSREPVLPDTFFNAGFFFMRLMEFGRARECFSRYISLGEEGENSAEVPAEIPPDVSDEKIRQAKKIVREISCQGLDDKNYKEAYDLVNREQNEEGLVKIRGFIETYPTVPNGWFVLGWALRKLGRYADGLESFRKAAEFGGANTDLRNETAICLMETGDLKGARKELEAALREDPENVKIISNLGVLAIRNGDNGGAAAFFRTVLELDPEDMPAKHFLEQLKE